MKRRSANTSPAVARYWSKDEHKRFLEAVALYGVNHPSQIAEYVGTRTSRQTSTHLQKWKRGRHIAPQRNNYRPIKEQKNSKLFCTELLDPEFFEEECTEWSRDELCYSLPPPHIDPTALLLCNTTLPGSPAKIPELCDLSLDDLFNTIF